MNLLSAHDLTVTFGGFKALVRATIDVPHGALVGIIGANGAGKSTLFSAITGYLPVQSGLVSFDGEDMLRMPVHRRVQRGLARTFQVPREFERLSVFDNMMVSAPNQAGERLLPLVFSRRRVAEEEARTADRAHELLKFLNLQRVTDEAAGRLSGGQKKLLELGRLLMLAPKCILLDEPFAGVNAVIIRELSERILELNRRGIAIAVIEHNIHELTRLVPKMYAMDRGQVIAFGQPREVLESDRVREAYMGGVI